MNITVVTGHLSRPPERRVLPSGDDLVGFDVTVDGPEERAESVPVVWPSAPPSAAALEAGAPVVVVGRVRRRFFRTAQGTQSRTEVVAERVVPARQGTAARRLVTTAVEGVVEGAEDFLAATRRPARRPSRTGPVTDAATPVRTPRERRGGRRRSQPALGFIGGGDGSAPCPPEERTT